MISIVATTLLVTLVVANPIVDLEFSFGNMVAANVGLALLTMVFGSISLAIGASTGDRGLTIGVSAGLTAAAFFVNGLAPLVDSISWTQKLTPFYWLGGPNPLAEGFDAGWSLLMVGFSAVMVVVAVWGFNRRDIAT